jgi:hypothetical protein
MILFKICDSFINIILKQLVIRYQLLLEHLGGKIDNWMKMDIRHEA